jgi:hypothetical protein
MSQPPPGEDQAPPEEPTETEDLGEPEDLGEAEAAPPLKTQRVRPGFEEFIRAGLALIFVVMLCATGAWAFIEIHSKDWDHVKALLDTLIPAETALLGSAVGFYFGTKK